MPRGVKNVQKVEADTTEVKTVETEVSANNETTAEEATAVAVEDVKDEEAAETAVEVKKDTVENKEDIETAEHEVQMLRGNFKVYRGRNIATITSLAAVVIPAGEVIEEDGIKWLPVIFTSRTGKQAAGFIITQ